MEGNLIQTHLMGAHLNSAGIIIFASLISLSIFVHRVHKKNEPHPISRVVVVNEAMRVPASTGQEDPVERLINPTFQAENNRPYMYVRDKK